MVPKRSGQREYIFSRLSIHIAANPRRLLSVVHPTWVRTPLIESLFQDREFHEFVLEPDTVAEAVVAQIRKAKSAQLILPGRYGLMSGVRVLPGWMQEILRNSVANLLRNPEK